MRYEFTLPTGRYLVRLHQVEAWAGVTGAGQRVFDVLAEGSVMLGDYDIYALVGPGVATVAEFEVDVSDGSLSLGFAAVAGDPIVSAIEVIEVAAPPPASALFGPPGQPTLVVD
jgi:hypothetical protein